MTRTISLQPTLWRTCRVLANHTRLDVFGALVQHQPQTVSALALRLQLDLPVASQSLRALEARGLLKSRRVGRRVEYRLSTDTTADSVPGLVVPLRHLFQGDAAPAQTIFKLSTAFTHPRRINILRALKNGACTFATLRSATRISARALRRHLEKLEARGFVEYREGLEGIYSVANRADGFGRALVRLASG